jgi:YggT family protein
MRALAILIDFVFTLYTLAIFARIFLPMLGVNLFYHPVGQWVFRLTEPLLRPIRERMPPSSSMVDWSPTIALIALFILRQIVLSIVLSL